jgi:hypothetical protein
MRKRARRADIRGFGSTWVVHGYNEEDGEGSRYRQCVNVRGREGKGKRGNVSHGWVVL